MISIEKINNEDEFIQCNSCIKSSDEADIYKIKIGKTDHQAFALKLCYDCMVDLGNQIYEIYVRSSSCKEYE